MIVSTYIWADILAKDQDHVLCISHFRHVFKTSVIHLMYGQEGKQNSLPWDPYIMCFAIYLDFPLNNYMAKTCCCIRHAGNNCAIVSWSGYICIWSGACDQESTNHSAHFVGWRFRCITKPDVIMLSSQ